MRSFSKRRDQARSSGSPGDPGAALVADAERELREPLLALRTRLASLQRHPAPGAREHRELIGAAVDELDRLATVVSGLALLARGAGGALGPADLSVAGGAATSALGRRAPQAALTFRVAPRTPPVAAAPDVLRFVVDHLLDNALRHGGRGGPVTIHVTTGPAAGGGAAITIDDDGPGIPAAERDQVLRRFGRGSTAYGAGSGLGLAIAAEATGHAGGTLRLEDSPLGGARVVAEFPSA